MSLDQLKQDTSAYLEWVKKHQDDQAEYAQGLDKFSGLQENLPYLDEAVVREIQAVDQEFGEARERLDLERCALEDERGRIVDEIQQALKNLYIAKEKMDAAANTMYGDSLSDARRACNRAIDEHKQLLEQIDAEKAFEPTGDNGAILQHVQSELSLQKELQIKADAIGMLVSITPAQKRAVVAYSSEDPDNSYRTTNPVLRGEISPRDVNAASIETIKDLHGLLSQQFTKQPITVYRGVTKETNMVWTGSGGRGLNEYSDNELIGKYLFDNAFVSTSLRETTAFDFYGVVLVLSLPKGTSGAYVGDISSFGSSENEFLMDCNQAFLVKKVERRNGKRYIYADSLRYKTDIRGE